MAKATSTKKTTTVAAGKKTSAQAALAKAKVVAAKKAVVKKAVAKKAVVKKAVVNTAAPATKPLVAEQAPAEKKAPEKAEKKTPEKAEKKTPERKAGESPVPPAVATAFPKPARKPSTVICPLSGFEVKPDKPNLSPRTIERLRAKLVEERDRHLHQADELAAEAEALAAEREGGDTQFDEESGEGDTVNIERERDLLLSASARQIVDEIDRALIRIKEKTYGLCAPAGRRISLERLEALPYADTCVECKARAERRR
ncbi:MAG TPA: TraR/DksA C4-type zinc finger protein [Acidimicrobiia bacterium]